MDKRFCYYSYLLLLIGLECLVMASIVNCKATRVQVTKRDTTCNVACTANAHWQQTLGWYSELVTRPLSMIRMLRTYYKIRCTCARTNVSFSRTLTSVGHQTRGAVSLMREGHKLLREYWYCLKQ